MDSHLKKKKISLKTFQTIKLILHKHTKGFFWTRSYPYCVNKYLSQNLVSKKIIFKIINQDPEWTQQAVIFYTKIHLNEDDGIKYPSNSRDSLLVFSFWNLDLNCLLVTYLLDYLSPTTYENWPLLTKVALFKTELSAWQPPQGHFSAT